MDLSQLEMLLSNLSIPAEHKESIMHAASLLEEKTVISKTVNEDLVDTNISLYISRNFISKPVHESSPDLIEQRANTDRYEDLGELGKGGMGVVRLVLDKKLNRRLAMKIIHLDFISKKMAVARFVEEAQVCAQLQHPNIVPVYDFGSLADGRLYFTMKEIKGQTLKSEIRSVHRLMKDNQLNQNSGDWSLRGLIDILLKLGRF